MMEMWDIYDKDKKRTGKLMKRNDWNMKPGEFHLTVIGIVQDLEGRFLVTRRNLDKEWAAGWWELPGGGVNSGEDSKDAIIREIKEEVGIDVTNAKGGHIYTYKNESPKEKNNYFVDVYNFVLDFKASDIKVQEEEVLEFNIATFEEIQNYEKEIGFLHYNSLKPAFDKIMKKQSPSMDAWLKEAKADPVAAKVGMFLVHNGVVRETAKAKVRLGEDVANIKKMEFSYDEQKVADAVAEAYKLEGIYYIKTWLNEGILDIGDDIMYVLIGGDIRPHVVDALQFLVGKIKNECVIEKEII